MISEAYAMHMAVSVGLAEGTLAVQPENIRNVLNALTNRDMETAVRTLQQMEREIIRVNAELAKRTIDRLNMGVGDHT